MGSNSRASSATIKLDQNHTNDSFGKNMIDAALMTHGERKVSQIMTGPSN